ncbi:MAG: hypothetical protein NTY38_17720 [Acidobacteria bacterium]|nr:hypothetical protein [Acidobacteriota bacterium]
MTVSLVFRRTHMYLALFLTPWMTMYALSTVVFNHGEFFQRWNGGEMKRFQKERQLTYHRPFPPGATARMKAEQIFNDLHLSGAFQLEPSENNDIVALRLDPVTPRRLTFSPHDHQLLLERETFRTSNFMTRLHASLGYGGKHMVRKIWAFSVDLTILATLLWIFTGFWMWWELKVTRFWGALATVSGFALFTIFLLFA